jgi:heterodisulfide reductase subunit A-like polyferredoxin
LIVGAGNVGLIVAFQLLQAGAEVAAAVEAAPQIGGWAVHANRLRREGVPILTSHTILAVEGREGVTSAVIGQLDGTGRPLVGSERRLRVDLVCLAVGLRPQTQLAGMLDLAMVDDPCRGGGVPWRDGALRSSDAHVYVVGDLGAVAEASIAMEEGRIAGLAAATSLGHGSPTDADRRIAEARERIAVLAAPIARGPGLAKQPGGHLGPIIECPERIPCDPCEAACPTGAIRVGPDPTAVPSVDAGRCDGCLRCVRACPGMAIFVRRAGPDPGEVMLALPWEFLPLPQTGDLGHGLDREGRRVCEVRVVGVRPFRKRGGTAVVQIAVPSRHARRVRGYARRSSR